MKPVAVLGAVLAVFATSAWLVTDRPLTAFLLAAAAALFLVTTIVFAQHRRVRAKLRQFYVDAETNQTMSELLCKHDGTQPECLECNRMSTGW